MSECVHVAEFHGGPLDGCELLLFPLPTTGGSLVIDLTEYRATGRTRTKQAKGRSPYTITEFKYAKERS